MTPLVPALLIGALLFGGFRAGRLNLDSPIPDCQDEGGAALTPVALTNDCPTGFFPLGPETLASAPPILVLTITRVVNAGQTGLGISVYLSFRSVPSLAGAKDRPRREKILIGNFSLYPSDRPAAFMLRTSGAFRRLQAAGGVSKSTEVRLLIEMKRIHERTPWAPVKLVFAPPQWRKERATQPGHAVNMRCRAEAEVNRAGKRWPAVNAADLTPRKSLVHLLKANAANRDMRREDGTAKARDIRM